MGFVVTVRTAGPALDLSAAAPATPVIRWMTQRATRHLAQVGPPATAGIALLAVTGSLVVISAPLLGHTGANLRALGLFALAQVAIIAVGRRLPWRAWNPWSTLAFPVAGLLEYGIYGLAAPGIATAYVGVIPLWFLYVGLFHRALAGGLLIPVAGAAYLAMVGVFVPSTIVRLVIYALVWFAISGILAVMSSRQRLFTQNLQAANHTDELTGLGNRRGLELRMADLVPGDSVAICDLDLFKSINDAFGHSAGDDVLRQFGATVGQHLRRRDYAARYGGEEFVLLLVRTDPAQALATLASLRAEWLDLEAGVTFSAGVSPILVNRGPTEALAAADSALYEAKAAGRDCFHVAHLDLPTPTGPTG